MPKFLSQTQRSLATAVLDRLIPPQGDMPGAGEAGTADYLDSVASNSAQLARLFSAGLQDIEIAAARSGVSFEELSGERQDEVLRGKWKRTARSSSTRLFGTLTTAITATRRSLNYWALIPGRPSRAATGSRGAT